MSIEKYLIKRKINIENTNHENKKMRLNEMEEKKEEEEKEEEEIKLPSSNKNM
jgi:hypothetical protein